MWSATLYRPQDPYGPGSRNQLLFLDLLGSPMLFSVVLLHKTPYEDSVIEDRTIDEQQR